MTHAELVALLTEQAETLQYFCDSRDGVSPATAGEIATRLRTAADALAGVGITKVQDMDCYEIRYRVSKREVHDYVGADFAGVVGRLVAHKWRTTFDAARAAGEG